MSANAPSYKKDITAKNETQPFPPSLSLPPITFHVTSHQRKKLTQKLARTKHTANVVNYLLMLLLGMVRRLLGQLFWSLAAVMFLGLDGLLAIGCQLWFPVAFAFFLFVELVLFVVFVVGCLVWDVCFW